jgi:hypothetical protein
LRIFDLPPALRRRDTKLRAYSPACKTRSHVKDCPPSGGASYGHIPLDGTFNEQEISLMDTTQPRDPAPTPVSPFDGPGAGDHDEPYRFGRRPNARAPFPFSERQYARLLVFRSRVDERRTSPRPVEWTVIEGGQSRAAA